MNINFQRINFERDMEVCLEFRKDSIIRQSIGCR